MMFIKSYIQIMMIIRILTMNKRYYIHIIFILYIIISMLYPCYIHVIFILYSYYIQITFISYSYYIHILFIYSYYIHIFILYPYYIHIFILYSYMHIISILYPLYIYSMFAMLKMVASFGVICQNFGCLRPLWLCQQFAIENGYLVR
jgi:hypothetical protein